MNKYTHAIEKRPYWMWCSLNTICKRVCIHLLYIKRVLFLLFFCVLFITMCTVVRRLSLFVTWIISRSRFNQITYMRYILHRRVFIDYTIAIDSVELWIRCYKYNKGNSSVLTSKQWLFICFGILFDVSYQIYFQINKIGHKNRISILDFIVYEIVVGCCEYVIKLKHHDKIDDIWYDTVYPRFNRIMCCGNGTDVDIPLWKFTLWNTRCLVGKQMICLPIGAHQCR